MKNILLISTVILIFTAVHLAGRQTPAADATSPCNEQSVADNKKKENLDHDPLLDPAEELRIHAQKRMEEKNFKELQAASTELAAISGKMSREIDASGQYAISLRVLDDLTKIEKLTKKVRSLAK